MSRRKMLESQLKKFRTIGIMEDDYKRILKEEKRTRLGIANIFNLALTAYLTPSYKEAKKMIG